MPNKKFDVVIIGSGAAGMTAALYSVRNGLKTGIVGKEIGGIANSILILENWPGFYGNGAELMKKFYDELKKYEVEFMNFEVDSVEKQGKQFLIKTAKGDLISNAVIIATGTERRKLKIKGEDKFVGKGVSYCATCDAFFFKNKTVAVVGGSDCAAVSAVALANIAKKVYIVYRKEKLRCEMINAERLKKLKNVEMIFNTVPVEIAGNEKVEELVVEKNNKREKIKVDGIFVEIGATPIVNFTAKLELKLDKDNYIIVDENMKTNVEGVFAAGDVTNLEVRQVVTAAGQGAIAGKNVNDFLRLGK